MHTIDIQVVSWRVSKLEDPIDVDPDILLLFTLLHKQIRRLYKVYSLWTGIL